MQAPLLCGVRGCAQGPPRGMTSLFPLSVHTFGLDIAETCRNVLAPCQWHSYQTSGLRQLDLHPLFHPQVQEVLARIVRDGRLTDSIGRTASFRSAVVAFTHTSPGASTAAHVGGSMRDGSISNAGTGSRDGGLATAGVRGQRHGAAHIHIVQHSRVPDEQHAPYSSASVYQSEPERSSGQAGQLEASMGAGYPPGSPGSVRTGSPGVQALQGLVDAVLAFQPLAWQDALAITRQHLNAVQAQVSQHAELEVDADAVEVLTQHGMSQRTGAAGIHAAVNTLLLSHLADLLLQHTLSGAHSSTHLGFQGVRVKVTKACNSTGGSLLDIHVVT